MTNRIYKTGQCRGRLGLLPARIEDYIGPDSPVRAIEAYVSALDLEKLGFRHIGGGGGTGQPRFDPADMLKPVGRSEPFAKPIISQTAEGNYFCESRRMQ